MIRRVFREHGKWVGMRLPAGTGGDTSSVVGIADMKLSKLLSADQILLDMKAVEHWSAITELVDHLVAIGRLPKEQREPCLAALKSREEWVSTGIGAGVAIPHAFSDTMDEVVAVFGCSKAGLDFESLDHAPVHFVILFIVPRQNYHLHLRTLAAIAKMFTNREIRRQLAEAETLDDILAIFDCKPSRGDPPGP
jgi:mannitol/fructose-specific phosphotransferase system IIA component (Ntr-type)